jgi:hypothetical protein
VFIEVENIIFYSYGAAVQRGLGPPHSRGF